MKEKLVEVKEETLSKIKEVLKVLNAIKDDLPGPGKAAIGILASIVYPKAGGKVKESYQPDELAILVASLEEMDPGFGAEEKEKGSDYAYPSYPKMTIAQLRSVLADLLRRLTDMLSQYGYKRPNKKYNDNDNRGYYPSSAPRSLRASAHLVEAVEGTEGSEWGAVLLEAGMSKNRHNYKKEVLEKAAPLFEGVKAYVDHKVESGRPSVDRSVRDLAGWFEGVHCDDLGIVGKFIVSEGQAWLRAMLKDAYERNRPDLVGFSIMAEGPTKLDRSNGQIFWNVESIDKVFSVDVVTEPAAGGRIGELIESEKKEVAELETLENISMEDLQSARPDLFAQIYDRAIEEAVKADKFYCPKCEKVVVADKAKDGKCPVCGTELTAYKPAKESEDAELEEARCPKCNRFVKGKKGEKCPECGTILEAYGVCPECGKLKGHTPECSIGKGYAAPGKKVKEEMDVEELKEIKKRLDLSEGKAILSESLTASDLPEPVKDKLRKRFTGKIFEKKDLDDSITEEKETLGKLVGQPESPYVPRVRQMMGPSDKVAKAMDGMMMGQPVDGIQPFRSLREAFAIYKGQSYFDVSPQTILSEAIGYDSGNKLVESVDTSSWAELLGDSITRQLLRQYRLPALEDWRLLCSQIGGVNDFRTQRRVRMGGYGVLPDVGQGADYQSLTSPTDEEVTWAVSKRGGLEDLTIETIINDDLGSVRQIPVRLARAAKITLYRYVFTLITSNPVIVSGDDEVFHANHANLYDQALSDAALTVAKAMMRDQTAYGAATEFLQLSPKYLLVPNEIEAVAKKLQTGEYAYRAVSGATPDILAHTSEINIHRNTFETIVVDFWTDPTDWYLVADPQMANTIEMGFLNNKQEPELLTQDQPTVGSVFTADKISYKIRHIYGGSILDHRSMLASIN